MPTPNPRRKPNADRRRALALLAGSPDGCTEAVMLAHGFKLDLLADLITAGLARAKAERMRVDKREIAVSRWRQANRASRRPCRCSD
jgi:hypothetical protein